MRSDVARGGSFPWRAPPPKWHQAGAIAGSMSRPEPVRIELVDDVEIVFDIEFIGRQDAVCIAGFEERDRDHQGAGELESVILGEDEVVRHLKELHRERANSRSMAPLKDRDRNAITAKAKLQRRHAGVADPEVG